jgi:predicted polyphosphate/ATP-dependent NAD kinase
MIRMGLIVNPVAGIGGRVGLKGSDGAQIQRRARELGAVPQALDRAAQALERLKPVEDLVIVTYPGEMGEDAAQACGFEPTVVGSITPGQTTAQDTRNAAQEMQRLDVELLLFAGGDGTARDVYQAVGLELPALGIPAGVKIHSAVYATSPLSAGELAALYLQGRVTRLHEAEVMDIDEEAFRQGVLSARLYGYLKVPFRTNLVQSLKMASIGGEASATAIAQDIVEKMEEDCLYIVGPGTTTRAITDELGLPKTLLGVDVILNRKLLATDVNEAQLLALLDEHRDDKARIVVTLIGGQGYLFGRGNQQISPRVIEKVGRDHIVVVSTREKLYTLGNQPLRVDTGDRTVDEMLCGYLQVVTGYHERSVRKVVC